MKLRSVFLLAVALCLPFGSLRASTAALKVHLMVHRDSPLRYENGDLFARNERFFAVLYTPPASAPAASSAAPFFLTRDYTLQPAAGAGGRLCALLKDPGPDGTPPVSMTRADGLLPIRFSGPFGAAPDISEIILTLTAEQLPGPQIPELYIVLMNTRTAEDPQHPGTFFCPPVGASGHTLGKTYYIDSLRILPVGPLPVRFPMMGLRDVYVALTDTVTPDGEIPDAFYESFYAATHLHRPTATLIPARAAPSAPALPVALGGSSDPDRIRTLLTPTFGAPPAPEAAFTLSLPPSAQGLMRYTVHTAVTPEGPWRPLGSLLPEGPAAYTLLRAEDYPRGLPLPKTGPTRFYRVLGE